MKSKEFSAAQSNQDRRSESGDLGEVLLAIEQLREALETLFNHPKLLGLSTSALSREIGVDRSTLQRLVQAVRARSNTRDVLANLPGTRGMRRCLDLWLEWAPDEDSREALERAVQGVESLDRWIRLSAGTRPKLLAQLEERAGSQEPEIGKSEARTAPSGSLRERLFLDAVELMGSSCQTAVKIFAYGLSEASDDRVERATLEAMYGYSATEAAMPLFLSLNTYYQDAAERPKTDFAPKGWVEEYSSTPPMVVSARTTPTRDALVLGEPGGHPSNNRDLCVCTDRHDYSNHPSQLDVPVQEVVGMVHYPASRLLQVVLLDRSLYRDSAAHWSEAKLWRPSLESLHGDRFLYCLPDAPALRIVDRLPEGLGDPSFPTLASLAEHLLGRSGWNPENFVALLIDVEFPIWRAGYSIGVDFT